MPKQTLKMKIADLLAQKGEGESVADDAGVAEDADIGAPPAEAPMPAPVPEAPEMEMPEAPEMEMDAVGGMPGMERDHGVMDGEYSPLEIEDAPEMDMNEKRDAAVAKSMNGEEGYASWQPKGDPYRYELIMGDAEDMSDAYIVATKDGKSVKIRNIERDIKGERRNVFEEALMMNPDFAKSIADEGRAQVADYAEALAAGKGGPQGPPPGSIPARTEPVGG